MRFNAGILLACLAAPCALAAVRLPNLLADHMVVQRGLPVAVWGWADAGERVTVSFRGESHSATADGLGRWSVALPPGEAGGPFELSVAGANRIVLRDLLVGDVWVAAGQSNMEWPVRWSSNAAAEMAAARYPKIRLVRAMHRVSDYPLSDFVGQLWRECSPASVEHFSAVAYHFGRELHQKFGVPIGLIQTAWGGTPAEAWTSLRALGADASLMPVFAEWAKLTGQHEANLLRFPALRRDWEEAAARARREGREPPPEPELRRRPGGQWTPAGLFNAMVAPLTRFPIRGVIWYQGEANTAPERAPLYGRLFTALIRDWRRAWAQGDFPFLFVQLANYRAAPDSMWPEVREAQRQALGLANTAMAVTIDIGNPGDIHPGNKREVGRRLSLAARALAYGETLVYSGPLARHVTREEGALRVWFEHAGAGLAAVGGEPRGFEVAGEDGRFSPARATIEGSSVLVSSPAVPRPERLRYGWSDNPTCTLFNLEGLPASPFRWPE